MQIEKKCDYLLIMIIQVDYDDIAGIFPDYPEEGEGGPQEMFEISAADIEVIFCYL